MLGLSSDVTPLLDIEQDFRLDLCDVPCEWTLQGVVYLGHGHFTSRFADSSGQVWYHDGIETGGRCTVDGQSWDDVADIRQVRSRWASLLIYRRRVG